MILLPMLNSTRLYELMPRLIPDSWPMPATLPIALSVVAYHTIFEMIKGVIISTSSKKKKECLPNSIIDLSKNYLNKSMDFNPVGRAFIIVSEKYLTKMSFSNIENNITFDNANLKKQLPILINQTQKKINN